MKTMIAIFLTSILTLAGIFLGVALVMKLSTIPREYRRFKNLPEIFFRWLGDPRNPKSLQRAINTCQVLRALTIIPVIVVTLLESHPLVQLAFWISFFGIGISAGGVTVNALRTKKLELEKTHVVIS